MIILKSYKILKLKTAKVSEKSIHTSLILKMSFNYKLSNDLVENNIIKEDCF